MVSNNMPADPSPHHMDHKVKIHLFQNMVMLHIKLNGTTNEATNILRAGSYCTGPNPLPPAMGVKSIDQHSTFLKHGHDVYQLKENYECSNVVAKTLQPDPDPWDCINRSKFSFFKAWSLYISD